MGTFLAEAFKAFVRALPDALVRVLLIVVVVGAAVLHLLATERITNLERSQSDLRIQNVHVLTAVNDLATEVRGYREDMREENRALKGLQRSGPGP